MMSETLLFSKKPLFPALGTTHHPLGRGQDEPAGGAYIYPVTGIEDAEAAGARPTDEAPRAPPAGPEDVADEPVLRPARVIALRDDLLDVVTADTRRVRPLVFDQDVEVLPTHRPVARGHEDGVANRAPVRRHGALVVVAERILVDLEPFGEIRHDSGSISWRWKQFGWRLTYSPLGGSSIAIVQASGRRS